jgi:ankyrin repeat protein
MMSRLVENGADVNCAGGKQGETPIFHAIGHSYGQKRIECVQMLISLGADIHFRNINGLTPLSLAAQRGSMELTKMLLERGVSANSRDLHGKCPLHYAAEAYFEEIHKVVALLIHNGANVNSRDNFGYTPLHSIVAKSGAWEAAAELLKAGADRYAMSNDGKFPHDMVPDGPWAETKRSLIRFYMP